MNGNGAMQRRNPLRLRGSEVGMLISSSGGIPLGPSGMKLAYTQIRTDGGTQMRAGLNEETVQEYLAALTSPNEWPFPAVVVCHDGEVYWLGDGFHRIEAARRYAEREQIDYAVVAEVRAGTRRDAVLCAAGANAEHGLRRTNADKRRAVEVLLRDEEWGRWSDREIARRCRVHHDLVASMRVSLADSASESGQSERRYTTKHGTTTTMKVGGQAARRRPLALESATDGEAQAEATPAMPLLTLDETFALVWRAIKAAMGSSEAGRPIALRLAWLASAGDGDFAAFVPAGRQVSPKTLQEAKARIGAELRRQLAQAEEKAQRRGLTVGAEQPDQEVEEGAEEVLRPLGGALPPAGNGAASGPNVFVEQAERAPSRADELLALYRQVIETLGEYSQLTGMFTHTLAARRALETMTETLKANRRRTVPD